MKKWLLLIIIGVIFVLPFAFRGVALDDPHAPEPPGQPSIEVSKDCAPQGGVAMFYITNVGDDPAGDYMTTPAYWELYEEIRVDKTKSWVLITEIRPGYGINRSGYDGQPYGNYGPLQVDESDTIMWPSEGNKIRLTAYQPRDDSKLSREDVICN